MPGHLWPEIRRRLKDALKHLWNMIAQLVRVKEWSFQGQVREPVLGLASVTVTITFG